MAALYGTEQNGITSETTMAATIDRHAGRDAMKTMGFCVLPVLLSIAAHGGVSDALSAPGPLQPRTPVSPSRAAAPPSLDSPAGGTVPDAPSGSPRNPNPTPMPAPASTSHYARSLPDRAPTHS